MQNESIETPWDKHHDTTPVHHGPQPQLPSPQYHDTSVHHPSLDQLGKRAELAMEDYSIAELLALSE